MTSSCNVDHQKLDSLSQPNLTAEGQELILKARAKPNFQIHPFEICFAGFSGSGKTTLIEKLINSLSGSYQIGCIKSDAHRIMMDHEGKDTDRFQKAGASQVYINNQEFFAHLGRHPDSELELRTRFRDSDFLFIEGWKYSKLPKILLLTPQMELMLLDHNNSVHTEDIERMRKTTLAFISPNQELNSRLKTIFPDHPHFQRDDIESIKTWILNYFEAQVKQTPIFGLVLAGGKSTRMGSDKASIKYQAVPQALRALEILKPYTDQVFLSRNPGQESFQLPKFQLIADVFQNMGPLSGVLSAMRTYPNATWVVIACDLPLLSSDTISHLLTQRKALQYATCYMDAENHFPEPLCTVFEPKSYPKLLEFLGHGYACPRKMLINSRVSTLRQISNLDLSNVNTPDEHRFIMEKL